jgi:hypothetical protein
MEAFKRKLLEISTSMAFEMEVEIEGLIIEICRFDVFRNNFIDIWCLTNRSGIPIKAITPRT